MAQMDVAGVWGYKNNMYSQRFNLLVFFALLGISGCAGSMALSPGQTELDTSSKSIVVFTIRTVNQLKPGYQTPRLCVFWKPESGEERAQNINDSTEVEGQYVDHVVSLALESGSYSISKVWGRTRVAFFEGLLQYNTNMKFQVPPNSVIYLGRLLLVNRQRRDGEERSGPLLPLDGQAIAGFSDGATDLTLSDASAEDIPMFNRKFPCLQRRTIQNIVLTRSPSR
jgi:hypothetical protein